MPTRKRTPRAPRRSLLVVTEGVVTEREYIDEIANYVSHHYPSATAPKPIKTIGVGKTPLKVVEACIAERNKAERNGVGYSQCVCLVDFDEHSDLEEAIRTAKRHDILILVSRLKFEVWLRWHASTSRAALTSRQLDQELEKRKLLIKKHLPRNFPYENVEEACKQARLAFPDMAPNSIGPDPSTSLPLLIDLLKGLPVTD